MDSIPEFIKAVAANATGTILAAFILAAISWMQKKWWNQSGEKNGQEENE